MGARSWIGSWPVYRQLAGQDRLSLGAAVKSKRSEELEPRVRRADQVVKSVCPYCAVGCAQDVYVEDGRVTQIEGDPDSPVNRGRLCPKGSASLQLTTGDAPRRPPPRPPPEGGGAPPSSVWSRPPVSGEVPAAIRHRLGRPGPRHGHG